MAEATMTYRLLLEGQEPREWREHPTELERLEDAVAVAQELLGGDDPYEDEEWVCEVLVYEGSTAVAIVNHHGTFLRSG